MKGATVCCFLAVTALAVAGNDKYPNRYDSIDVESVLGNDRLLTAYINCVLEKGKCTAEGRELKSHIQDALENHCSKCTDVQRGWIHRVLGHLINNRPSDWISLVEMYDPQRIYTVKYEDELRNIKG